VKDLEPVTPSLTGRLDQNVGPAGISWIEQVEPLGDPGTGKSQVALRIGRGRPEPVPPGIDVYCCDPVGVGAREVSFGVLAGPERQQLLSELTATEPMSSACGNRCQSPRHARAPDEHAGAQPTRNAVIIAPGNPITSAAALANPADAGKPASA